jgi:hypothetical protein
MVGFEYVSPVLASIVLKKNVVLSTGSLLRVRFVMIWGKPYINVIIENNRIIVLTMLKYATTP